MAFVSNVLLFQNLNNILLIKTPIFVGKVNVGGLSEFSTGLSAVPMLLVDGEVKSMSHLVGGTSRGSYVSRCGGT